MKDIKFLHAFNLVYALGPARLTLLKRAFGTYEDAWHKNKQELERAGMPQEVAEEIDAKRIIIQPDQELKKLFNWGIWVLTPEDQNYPPILKTIHLPPPIIYVRGKIADLKNPLAVVGSRKATAYGMRATQDIVRYLVDAGCEIISGLAMGIDTAAHLTTLDADGITMAVLGSGIDQETIFPSVNRGLAEKIIKSGGAIISEFPPGTPPMKHHFPQRNRIIAGLAKGTIVVEAKEKSGALITARLALEENREVFALPGSIFSPYSRGPHNLIKDGAVIISSGKDILDALGINYQKVQKENFQASGSPEELRLLEILEEPLTIDDICLKTNYSSSVVATLLSRLELKGAIKKIGTSFVKS